MRRQKNSIKYRGCLVLGVLFLNGCVKDRENTFAALKVWMEEFPYSSFSLLDDPIVARAGNVVIRKSDFMEWVYEHKKGVTVSNVSETDRHRGINQLLNHKMMVQLAAESGILKNPIYRQSIIEMQNRQLVSIFLNQIPVNENETKTYYLLHAKEFASREVDVTLVIAKSMGDARKDQAALRRGNAVRGSKVQKVSLAPVLGAPKNLELEAMVAALKPTEVSQPVKTSMGFTVVRRERSPIPSFEMVKDQIKSQLQAEKAANMSSQALAARKVEVDDKLLNSLDLTK